MEENNISIQNYNEIICFLSHPLNDAVNYTEYNEIEDAFLFYDIETKLIIKSKLHSDKTFTIFAKSFFLKKTKIDNIEKLCTFISYNKIFSLKKHLLN